LCVDTVVCVQALLQGYIMFHWDYTINSLAMNKPLPTSWHSLPALMLPHHICIMLPHMS